MGASLWFDEKDGGGITSDVHATSTAAVLHKGCFFTFDLLVAICFCDA